MPRFAKYSGAGNDFVVMMESDAPPTDLPAYARQICARRTGVGVDGLILMRPDGDERVAVRFFNPDGSEFGTCGNGSRCAARYAYDEGLVGGDRFILATPPADIECRVEGDDVALTYAIETWVDRPVSVNGPEGPVEAFLVQIGLPHLVVPVEKMPEGEIESICRPLRRHADLGPEGANVNLVELATRDAGRIRTFERGVEGETQACGSGSIASVIALYENGRCEPDVALRVTGGDPLNITIAPGAALSRGSISSVGLAGPAVRVYHGEYPDQD